MARCVDNVTENRREIEGYACQSTVVPSDIRGQSMVSSQPFSIGDKLVGKKHPNINIALKWNPWYNSRQTN